MYRPIMRPALIFLLLWLFGLPVFAEIPSAASLCESGLTETTPSSDFSVVGNVEDGIVRHKPTGLDWRRCAEGMRWTGSDCEGAVRHMAWEEALDYADEISGWRLPNIRELASIVEFCRHSPSVNLQVFPRFSPNHVWSASPRVDSPGFAWNVRFLNGHVRWASMSDHRWMHHVILVRGGE